MSKEILIRKGWSMISYPDEVVISSLNIQPSNPITEGWYWYPENDGVPTYDTDLIYNSSTQPENREYIERIYVDESCSFPNGRFYKVFSMFPGRGYLVLNRGEDTTLSIPDENSFNKSLGGNQITLYKGWNAISTPKNNESFILQPEISTNSEIIWHWEQHQQPSINVSLLYGDGETPTFQDITKSNQEGCLYPSGRQYSADKMMTGFGYLINNITNTNITWTVPDVPIPAGNLQIVSGTGGYDVTGFNAIGLPLTTAVKFNSSVGTLDTYTQNDDGGFGSSFTESTWSNKHPSSNFTNGLPDFNIYLENATETTAELWIQSNNPNNNSISGFEVFNFYFIVKNNLGDIDKSKITWYNNITDSIQVAYDNAKLLFELVGPPAYQDPGNILEFDETTKTTPYSITQGQMTTSINPDPLCWMGTDDTTNIPISSNNPIQLGYIKYTE